MTDAGSQPTIIEAGTFYVYALKDPRNSPAKPFYIGKGTGARAWEHALAPDLSAKGQRISAIQAAGKAVLATIVVDGLTEMQALRVEAELIAGFGIESAGGILTNVVAPSGTSVGNRRKQVVVPAGAYEKAQLGLELLKSSVLELAKVNARGITNADASRALGLRSDYGGGSKDYLSYSVLGILMSEGRLRRENGPGRGGRHVAQAR
jgi:hypothetical protein